jgi:hypothetical protein
LHFVRDDKTRFELALECGNLDVALETAKSMDKPDHWTKLGAEALRHGNYKVKIYIDNTCAIYITGLELDCRVMLSAYKEDG